MKTAQLWSSMVMAAPLLASAYLIPARHQVQLVKRGVATIQIKADTWKQNTISFVSNDAENSQLAFLGFSDKRDISGWTAYYNANRDKFTTNDPVNLIMNSPIRPLAAVFVIALIMMIIVPLFGCCFGCFRLCDCCGKRKPSPDGYSKRNIYGHLAVFGLMTILAISFSALFLAYSGGVTTTINGFNSGITATLSDANSFTNTSVSGIIVAPQIATDTILEVVTNLTTRDLPAQLNATLRASVYTAAGYLTQLGGIINQGIGQINATGRFADGIVAKLNQIPPKLNNISATLSALQYVTIRGVPYTINGFPSTSGFSVSVPTSSIPSLSSVAAQLSALPNLPALANQITGTFDNLTSSLTSLLNSTLSGQVNIGNLTSGLSTQLNGITSLVQNATVNVQANYITPAFSQVSTYDGYRSIAMAIPMVLLIVGYLMAVVGALFKRRHLMCPIMLIIILVSALIWLQFLIFYIASAPVNILCNSRDAVLNQNYNISALNATIGGVPSFVANYTINPQSVINGCIKGQSLFSVDINTNGATTGDVIESGIIFVQSLVDTYLNKTAILAMLPDLGSQVDTLANIDLSALNVSGYVFPNVLASVNISGTVSSTRSQVSILTPTSIDSDLGNLATLASKLMNFNDFAVTVAAAGYTNFTQISIQNSYVIPNITFKGYDVTQDSNPNSQNNVQLVNLFYGSGSTGLFGRVAFYYSANATLDNVKLVVNQQMDVAQSIQDVDLVSIQADVNTLQNMTLSLTTSVSGQILTTLINMRASIINIKTVTASFVDWVIAYLKNGVKSGLETLVSRVLLNNPIANFGKCDAIAGDMQYMVDGVCVGLLGVLSGLWYSAMLVGVFIAIGFIVIARSKKRVEFLETGGSSSSLPSGKGAKKFSDTEQGKLGSSEMVNDDANESVQKTRQMDEDEGYENNLPSYNGDDN